MNIRFISSLDAEDEMRFATAAIAALARVLDEFPIAYTIRMETAAGKVLEHHHASDAGTVAPTATDAWQSLATRRAKST
jgi:hypothetical protein